MLRHLPSLPALRVFEAAGRLESFTLAADELDVTTSAVSRQIGALERALGVRLFERLPRGLRLTREGTRYLAEVADALRRLEQASMALRGGGARRTLRLSVLPSFAGNWLVPRLHAFEAAHPDVDLLLEATTRYADFRHEQVDLAIRFGTGPWAGLASEALLPLEFYPVCRPDRLRTLRRPADLARETWLDEVHVPQAWATWLATAGVQGIEPARRLTYDNAQLMLDAAMAGQGVALATDVLAERWLRERRQVQPFAVRAASDATYHLVMRPEDRSRTDGRAFRDWIVAEMTAWTAARRAFPARKRR
jgi:LysR family glycine cleavage system transcriptional activator